MIRNFIKIAFRNLWRFKEYSLINIFGLALGLTTAVLILLYITDELGYDSFHEKGDRIYKVVTKSTEGEGMETNGWPVGYRLKNDFPEVETAVYTRRVEPIIMVNHENKRYEHTMFYADNEFFDIFSFQFIEGSPSRALDKPYTMVLTRSMRDQYFTGMAVGESITMLDSLEFTITGVIEDIPAQSHIQFEALVSFATFEQLNGSFSYNDGWGNINIRNYILLKEGAGISGLEEKASGLYEKHFGEFLAQMGVSLELEFIPLKDIYLKTDYANGFGPKGSIRQVYMLAGIGVFVLILACINYINLSTARSVYRAREVGMRKIVGSSRTAIFWQFQMEVLVITLISFGLVALFIDMILPFFNDLMGKEYVFSSLLRWDMFAGVAILILLISFISGYYPSSVLSGYLPSEVLKGRMSSGRKGIALRRSLVIFQFGISGILVMATFIVLGQLKYMQEEDLGFEKEQVLVLDVSRVPRAAAYDAFGQMLRDQAGVSAVSYTNALPGRPGWQGQWAYPEEKGMNGDYVETEYMAIDEHYIPMLDLTLIAGTNFSDARPADLQDGLIINEKTVKEMGWETPDNAIGKRIVSPSGTPEGRVIGVVQDFHGLGLKHQIWPMAMAYSSQSYGRYFAVRFTTGNTTDLLATSQNLWENALGDYAFEYFFLDEEFDKQYREEQRLMKVFVLFAILTVIIAAIGLLGLVSFMIITRTREIGIRKVLGSNTSSIVGLLSKEFLILVLVANVIIIPLVWIAGNSWLDNFAYHMPINPMVFILTLGLTLVLAMIVVGVQSVMAARRNPAEIIRSGE